MRELTIDLNTKAEMPLYEQIYTYIKQDIQKKKILAGEKLPSGRALSRYLEVSRSTVDLAYEQLLSEGYIESVPCKGYYVCEIEGLYHLQDDHRYRSELPRQEVKKWIYDFTPNGIDLDSFPYDIWRKVTRNVLLDDQKTLFQLGNPKGEEELRETISHYLHQARGVNCHPEQILLGAGNDYLMMLICALLGKRRLAMESPTYKHAYRIFQEMGLELCTVPIDAFGMEMKALRASEADVAYVMPSHQYPLGVVMPIKRRMQLLKWAAEKEDRFIIEDDYDSEFRYRGKPIPALQGADQTGSVIYIGTFSKSIAPAIRISYLVLPEKLLKSAGEKLSHFSSTVSRIDQMILNSFIREGHFERHLNRMRAIYSRKQEVLISGLKGLAPVCTICGADAGVHLLLEFHNGRTEKELVYLAEAEGIRVYPLSAYDIDVKEPARKRRATILLGYATMTEEELKIAAEILVKIWKA